MERKGKKPIFKKWWFWLIVIVVIVAVGAAAGGSGDEPSAQAPSSAPSSALTAPADSAGQPEPSEEAQPSQEAEPSNVFHPGDAAETKTFRITYQECDTDWKGYSQYLGPKDGNRIVRAYFVMENISNSDQGCGAWEFSCYADGVAADAFYFSSDDAMTSYDSISSGRKLQGYVAFEVPEDAETVELEYETSFWTQDKIIFMIE